MPYKKKKSYSKGGSAKALASRALVLAKKLQRTRPKPEDKYKSGRYTAVSIGNTGAAGAAPTYTLCSPAQGDSQNERDGDSIKLKHLRVQGALYGNASWVTPRYVTMIVYWDKENDKTISEVINGADIATSNAPFGQQEWDNKFSLRILKRVLYKVGPANAGNALGSVPVKLELSLKSLYQSFDAGTTTPTQGMLKLAFISQDAVNKPTIDFVYRCIFTG